MEEKKEKAEGEIYGDQDDLIESNNLSKNDTFGWIYCNSRGLPRLQIADKNHKYPFFCFDSVIESDNTVSLPSWQSAFTIMHLKAHLLYFPVPKSQRQSVIISRCPQDGKTTNGSGQTEWAEGEGTISAMRTNWNKMAEYLMHTCGAHWHSRVNMFKIKNRSFRVWFDRN